MLGRAGRGAGPCGRPGTHARPHGIINITYAYHGVRAPGVPPLCPLCPFGRRARDHLARRTHTPLTLNLPTPRPPNPPIRYLAHRPFDKLAAELINLAQAGSVRTVSLIPHGVIRTMYPLKVRTYALLAGAWLYRTCTPPRSSPQGAVCSRVPAQGRGRRRQFCGCLAVVLVPPQGAGGRHVWSVRGASTAPIGQQQRTTCDEPAVYDVLCALGPPPCCCARTETTTTTTKTPTPTTAGQQPRRRQQLAGHRQELAERHGQPGLRQPLHGHA